MNLTALTYFPYIDKIFLTLISFVSDAEVSEGHRGLVAKVELHLYVVLVASVVKYNLRYRANLKLSAIHECTPLLQAAQLKPTPHVIAYVRRLQVHKQGGVLGHQSACLHLHERYILLLEGEVAY